MAGQILLAIEAGSHGPELAERLRSAAEQAGLSLHPGSEERALEILAGLVEAGAEIAAVLIGAHVEHPVPLARRLYRAMPTVQVLFVADHERAAQLRREMSLAPMVGTYRVVSPSEEALARLLKDVAQSSRQRRQVRTTLDRINLGLVRRPPVDSPDLRKLVISDRYLASILQQAPDAILPLDDGGRVLALNRAAEEMFGVAEARAAGRPLSALVPEAAELLAGLLEAVRAGAPGARSEASHLREDGTPVFLEISLSSVRDESGQRMGFLAIARDISARRQAESERVELLERERAARAEAEAASRAKDEFLATVSHELRTPLTSMLGWARLLRSGSLDEKMFARAVETIERNAFSQAQLIEDLLDISRVITGKLRLNLQRVELSSVIEAAVDSVRPAAQAKEIRLQLILDSAIGPVLGDPGRLQQIVWNLVSNAVKFTPKGGRVQVLLERINSHVEITVHDTGRGITPEFLPHVFERFRQAESISTRTSGGLGLGLAIVRHLTELHGGTVEVHSEGTGRGATFTVRLPLAALARPDVTASERIHSAGRTAIPFETTQALAGLRLLVVDDEPDTLEMLSFILRRCGAEVRTASSAAAALEELSRWQPDLLLSDIGMSGEDGYSLLRKVRALDAEWGRRLPAIALTAFARPEDRVRLLSAGFQVHLPKPVDPSELVAAIVSQTRSLP